MPGRLARSAALWALVVLAVASVVIWSVVRSNRLADADESLQSRLDQVVDNQAFDLGDADDVEAIVPYLGSDRYLAWSYFPDDGDVAVYDRKPSARSADAVEALVLAGDGGPWTVPLEVVPAASGPPGPPHRWLVDERSSPDDRERLVIAVDLQPIERSLQRLGLLLAGLTVGGAALIGAVVLFTARRALRPVEAVRAAAEQISAHHLDGRVPVPERDDAIRRLAVTTNDLLDRIEHAQRARRQFVADAGHELRNPVATLVAQLETSLRTADAGSAARTADTDALLSALGASRRLQRLVDDLLLLAVSDAHGLVLHRSPVDLDEVVMEIGHSMRATTRAEIDLTGVSAAAAVADRDRLAQVVANLLANATRAARHRVVVTVHESDGTAILRIEDDGPGIAAEDRERVLERFVRLDDARATRDGGSGLGLAICTEIVAAHDGRLRIEDAVIGGAAIVVTLPVGALP